MIWRVREFFRLWCIVNGDRNSEPVNASAAGTAEQTDTDAGTVVVENEDLSQQNLEEKEIETKETKKKLTELDFKV
jgi:hypothetical protein